MLVVGENLLNSATFGEPNITFFREDFSGLIFDFKQLFKLDICISICVEGAGDKV